MITIAFKSGETPIFHPGSPIEGNVDWTALSKNTTSLEVRLIWFTVGRGDQDAQFVDAHEIEAPAESGQFHFSFVAPHRPNSFKGKLIAIQWAVEVIAFPQRDAEQAPLTIHPPVGGIVLQPVEDGKVFWKQSMFGKLRERKNSQTQNP